MVLLSRHVQNLHPHIVIDQIYPNLQIYVVVNGMILLIIIIPYTIIMASVLWFKTHRKLKIVISSQSIHIGALRICTQVEVKNLLGSILIRKRMKNHLLHVQNIVNWKKQIKLYKAKLNWTKLNIAKRKRKKAYVFDWLKFVHLNSDHFWWLVALFNISHNDD